MKSGTLFAYFVTFTASFCIMVIELVAGRILAPYIGQHLYSWTSIIGVCLGGISIGAWLGGWLADKFPRRATLGWFLLFAGLLSMAIPILTDTICNWKIYEKGEVSLMWRIVVYTSIIFLPATIVLGMISPMVIKLIIKDLSNAGSIVGRIYAFSTIGSILGTFATGFFLIEEYGTRTLLYGVGTLLMVMAPLAGGLFYSGTKYVGGGFVAGLLLQITALALLFPQEYAEAREKILGKINKPAYVDIDEYDPKRPRSLFQRLRDAEITRMYEQALYFKESNYFTLRVITDNHTDSMTQEERELNYLILDNLTHSHSDVSDPTYLEYEYLRIYEELVGWQLNRKGSTKHSELFIGGGGYTMQRFFHHTYKDCQIEVAEIDPKVTYVAETYMGAPKNDPRLVTKNEDARLYVLDKQKTNNKYEFIFGDAFNDLSVPFHLTTLEFDQQLKNLLTPNGLVMSLVIDHVSIGKFLPSFIATMRKAFGDENVVLILTEAAKDRQKIIDYLKKNELEKYIEPLSKGLLEDVIKDLDATKYATQIAWLKKRQHDEHSPYLKPTDLDYFTGHDTVIVVGSASKQNWDDFEKYLGELNKKYEEEKSLKHTVSHVIRPETLTTYLNTRWREPTWLESLYKKDKILPWTPIILTDDYAPVDNLTAPLFEKRFGYRKKSAQVKQQQEDEDAFVDELLKAIK